jgi:hypothetical protein
MLLFVSDTLNERNGKTPNLYLVYRPKIEKSDNWRENSLLLEF